jgi:serine/threonine protein phosphatase PrpC
VSRLQHVLTNVLGGADDQLDVDVDIDVLRLGDGDRLLLCSDGLSDLVDDDAIARTLAATPKSQDACAALVQLALERGGRDNVTVIVASYGFPDVLAATRSV